MSPAKATTPKNWTTKTVIRRFAAKVQEATGENIMDKASPARDESVGDMLQMLSDFEMFDQTQQIPGQSAIAIDDGVL